MAPNNVIEGIDTVIYVGAGAFIIILILALSYYGYAAGGTNLGSPSISASVSGGVPPYTYQWYTGNTCSTPIVGQTGQSYAYTSDGPYSVLVTDSASSTLCAAITI